jgi:hypothetical protein
MNNSPLKEVTQDFNDNHIHEIHDNELSHEDEKTTDSITKKKRLKRTISDVLKEKREMFEQIDNYELTVNQPLKKQKYHPNQSTHTHSHAHSFH